MPPKPKLHKSTGKSTISNKVQDEQPSTSSAMNPEMEQQFEVELCWCIQQLQLGLKSNKLNNKQIQDHTKALNTLMSNSAPLVKKRQVMRLSFGDYRAKMAIEDKKHAKNVTNMKVVTTTPSKKSVFVKKSAFSSSNNSFRFNFDEPQDLDMTNIENKIENISDIVKKPCDTIENPTLKQTFTSSSGNAFKFNFNVESES